MWNQQKNRAEIDDADRKREWLAMLDAEEMTIADVAITTFRKIVIDLDMVAGCYHLAFFLREYLARQHKIDVEIVLGWVTGKNSEWGMSHAWIEFKGKKTDISIWNNESPEIFIPGSVLIHDFDYQKGMGPYIYYRNLPPDAIKLRQEIAHDDVDFAEYIRAKDADRLTINTLLSKVNGGAEYFSDMPSDESYECFVRLIC